MKTIMNTHTHTGTEIIGNEYLADFSNTRQLLIEEYNIIIDRCCMNYLAIFKIIQPIKLSDD